MNSDSSSIIFEGVSEVLALSDGYIDLLIPTKAATMASQCSENVIPTLRDFFNSQKPGEEDEFMVHQVLNSSSKNIPPRPTKLGNKAKERHGLFNQGRIRSRRNISDAEKFSVEQYSSSGFFGVRFNTNGRQQQQQRSAKPLGSDRNMEPRLQKSFSARMQLPFMLSSKPSNQSTNNSSWFSRIKKMSNPFSNRNSLIPKSGEIKVSGVGETLSRNKSSSPVHLHAHLSIQHELGMPVFTFSLDHPDDVYTARTWMDVNDSRFVYSFRYIGGRSNKNLGEQRSNVSGIDSSLIGQMQVSTQVSLEVEEEPYEDPVESAVSEFVLFDIARARRSGLKSEQLSRQNSVSDGSKHLQRQNSFSRGLTRSFSKHSENSATSSDPLPATDLHPGLEIAAVVIRDSSSSNNESLECMKNSKLSRREMKVIVPSGNHGLPDAENSCPTPILQRWRSGGGCDCSGWDMGCHLFVLEEQQLINNHHCLELFIEGEKESTPAMTMAFMREGHYEYVWLSCTEQKYQEEKEATLCLDAVRLESLLTWQLR
ncbi:hypothetical protein Rs2_42123 [Raphanus sativus]|nr:hypothetical protein Rs2_42123 [Raphanus sativus]